MRADISFLILKDRLSAEATLMRIVGTLVANFDAIRADIGKCLGLACDLELAKYKPISALKQLTECHIRASLEVTVASPRFE